MTNINIFALRRWRPPTNYLVTISLLKQVKELTEVNHVGKNVSAHSGRSMPQPDRHSRSGSDRSGSRDPDPDPDREIPVSDQSLTGH